MVSRLPVLSGKQIGTRVRPEMVLPVFVVVVLFVAVLLSYPWHVLATGTLCYLVSLPFGWLSYRRYEREAAATATSETPPADKPTSAAEPTREAPVRPTGEAQPSAERPARLN
jgi:CDP-diacylglycerol--serine O-phosphatidyltransferase